MLLKANSARVEWDSAKKRWEVHVQVGAEVIKRPLGDTAIDAGQDAVRQRAVETARDEGYELNPQDVQILQGCVQFREARES
jgi:hypothetical protein